MKILLNKIQTLFLKHDIEATYFVDFNSVVSGRQLEGRLNVKLPNFLAMCH